MEVVVTMGLNWLLLEEFSSLFHGNEQRDGREQGGSGVVWVMETLAGWLQQSWVDISLDFHWTSSGMFSPEQSMKQGRRTWRHRAQPSSALIFITNKDPV